MLSNPSRVLNPYSVKQKAGGLGGGYYSNNSHNYSAMGAGALGLGELDIQGKSVVNSKPTLNNSYM